MPQSLISWQAPEFEYRRKTADWYWALWIIVAAIAVISILFSDILLGLLVIVGAFAISLLSNKRPRLVRYELTSGGVRIGNALYPYDTLQSFNIEELGGEAGGQNKATMMIAPKILIKSRKLFMPLIIIPLAGVRTDDVHGILAAHLTQERELHEPLLQKLVEFLGF